VITRILAFFGLFTFWRCMAQAISQTRQPEHFSGIIANLRRINYSFKNKKCGVHRNICTLDNLKNIPYRCIKGKHLRQFRYRKVYPGGEFKFSDEKKTLHRFPLRVLFRQSSNSCISQTIGVIRNRIKLHNSNREKLIFKAPNPSCTRVSDIYLPPESWLSSWFRYHNPLFFPLSMQLHRG
jgi:hypothetical protein